jgi:hypothetical protein
VPGEGVRQRDPGLDVLAHLDEGLAQLVVLDLVLEHVERPQQRQARGDHRRELSRRDGELVRLHALEAVQDVVRARGRALLDVDDDQALAPQVRGDRLLGLGLELAAGRDAGEVERLERVGRHRQAAL